MTAAPLPPSNPTSPVESVASLDFHEDECCRALLNQVALGVTFTNPEGHLIYVNRKYAEMLGYTPEELLHQNYKTLVHPEDLAVNLQDEQRLVAGDIEFYRMEKRFLRKDQSVGWGHVTVSAIRDANGTIKYNLAIIEDISKRKQAEANLRDSEERFRHLSVLTQSLNAQLEERVANRTAQLRQSHLKLQLENTIRKYHEEERQRAEMALSTAKDQLQAVLDAVPGCVAWVDEFCHYLGVNQNMANLFRRSPDDFVGQPVGFLALNHNGFHRFIHRFSTAPSRSQSGEIELKIDGEERFYLIVGQKYLQDKAAVFVAIDITERKKAELETHNALLKTQELSNLKSRFLSMASHEFRTPLTSILSAGELLEHYGYQWPPEKQHHYLKQIQTAVHHMTCLLEDVLMVNEGEAGQLKLRLESFDLVAHCEALVKTLGIAHYQSHPIRFETTVESYSACLDKTMLNRILENLLTNAIKYSPPHTPIDFKLEVSATQIVFTILDRGIGIPEEDQKHLFSVFHRAKNVGTIPGTGLGLVIANRAIQLHGGTLEVQSKVNHGTQIQVVLPGNLN